MALTLIATPGAVDANTYATRVEGDAYHDERLHVTGWSGATGDQKDAGLVWATRLLDENMDWAGIQRWDTQLLRWPRSGLVDLDGNIVDDETIPTFLRNATAELGRLLIEADRTADRGTIGFESIQVGPISLDIDKHDEVKIIPDSVWAMISNYGVRLNEKASGFSSVGLMRV